MTIQSVLISPPNSLICISDPTGGRVPDFIAGQLVLATPSFIIVNCLPFIDGETRVTLGPAAEVAPDAPPAYDAILDTAHHAVIVSTV